MIRTVPTGDLGLDVLLGGGWRLVRRLGDAESTTVVVRGGSGAGKTLVGVHVALELARALGGDVVVGCVEILPTEYVAQLQSARPSLPADRVAMLPTAATSADGPRVYVGLMLDLDPEQPDLNASLLTLRDATATAGGKPVVFVVDSLIEGYGIGSSAPRIAADDCMKFAAKHGVGLVLCEEIVSDAPSPWVFAADTVLQLGVESRERGRWIEIKKHRFGPSATGRHELVLAEAAHPQAFPSPGAWVAPHVEACLVRHGWAFAPTPRDARVTWDGVPIDKAPAPADLVFIGSDRADLARGVAHRCVPVAPCAARALTIEFDPLARQLSSTSAPTHAAWAAPFRRGPAVLLRWLVEALGPYLAASPLPSIGRIIVGDAGVLMNSNDLGWMAAVETFAALVATTSWGIPVIVFDGFYSTGQVGRAPLTRLADIWVEIDSGAITPGGQETVFYGGRWASINQAHGWKRGTIQQALRAPDAAPSDVPRSRR